jgi:pyridoxal phosphate enzyme (YggS family)
MLNSAPASLTGMVRHRLAEVREEIAQAAQRVGRRAEDIRLIAVTKTHAADLLAAAAAAGCSELGENYPQEAIEKFSVLGWPDALHEPAPVMRHLIGHLQTNKVRNALTWFEMIQTVDSIRLAQRVNTVAGDLGRLAPVLLEINICQDTSKFGLIAEEVEGLFPELEKLAHIQVMGLMTIGRFSPDPEAARGDFIALRELCERLRSVAPPTIHLDELSMGMSHDFPVAIEEGATMVRIGSRLFGPRM